MSSFRSRIGSLADEYERVHGESLALREENFRLTQELVSLKDDCQVPSSSSRISPSSPRSKDVVDIDRFQLELLEDFPHESTRCAPGMAEAKLAYSTLENGDSLSFAIPDPCLLDVWSERQTLAPCWAKNQSDGNATRLTPISKEVQFEEDEEEVSPGSSRSLSDVGEQATAEDRVEISAHRLSGASSMTGGTDAKPAGVFSKWFDPGFGGHCELDVAALDTGGNFDGRMSFAGLASRASGRSEKIVGRGLCVLHPFGKVRLSWDVVALLCLLVDLWLTPLDFIFMTSFPVPQALNVITHSIFIFFTLDILLNFSTGYVLGDQIIMARSGIIINYLKGWFWVDLIATIPFYLLDETGTGDVMNTARAGKASKVLRALRYLKMVRAVRLVKSLGQVGLMARHIGLFSVGPVRYAFRVLQVILFLSVFAHLHGCIWGAMQPQWVAVPTVSDALRCYWRSFCWAYTAATVGELGSTEGESTPLIWLLELAITTERLFLIVLASMKIVSYSLSYIPEAEQEYQANALLIYLRQREVSIETQIQASFFLTANKKARKLQNYHEALISHDLPMELKMTIADELWMDRLATLGLIAHISSWHPMFLVSLAHLVKEEVYAARSLLYKEGDRAELAYFIIQGELVAIRGENRLSMPKFTRGMWVGENALASAGLHCFATIQARVLTCCMIVTGDSFQSLLSQYGLMTDFEDFCSEHLWKGLCGRCGVLGDHFSDSCPGQQISYTNFIPFRTEDVTSQAQIRLGDERVAGERHSDKMSSGSLTDSWTSEATKRASLGSERAGGWRSSFSSFMPKKASIEESEPNSPRLGRDLVHFLTEYNLVRLYNILQQLHVHHLDRLEEIDVGLIQSMLSTGEELTTEEEKALSKDTIKDFKDRCKNEVNAALFRKVSRLHHYIFLSHYKVEAGTEAALMRTDIEQVLAEDPDGPSHWFDEPVFLDSENLTNLKDLQLRVRNTHNLVLLLTKEVLLRPWVLVEIATATKNRMQILPVTVNKPGNDSFVYPDDTFYGNLRDGKLLDQESKDLLERCGCSLEETEKAVRAVFQQIAGDYSPHKPSSIRRAEIEALLKNCRLKDSSGDLSVSRKGSRQSSRRRNSTSGQRMVEFTATNSDRDKSDHQSLTKAV